MIDYTIIQLTTTIPLDHKIVFLTIIHVITILIDWLIGVYGTSTQDRSICANLPGGITGSGA